MYYCINLPRRRDRWRRMIRRFRALDMTVERFSAIDGYAINVDEVSPQLLALQYDSTANAAWDPLVSPGIMCRLTPGEVGCTLSHIAVWDELLSRRERYAIVLEDDVDMSSRFPAFANEVVERLRAWDLIYFGYQTVAGDPAFHSSKELARPRYLFGTYAYAISRSGAERIMSLLPVVGPLDVFLSTNFRRLSVWCTTSPLVNFQPRSMRDSDVVHSAHTDARRELRGALARINNQER
ncbi:MAG: glycosyltransferase family 25 protein [Kofleriaceae bacterium]